MAVTFHTGRQCKEGSREGGQGLDAQEDKEEEEGGMNPFVFGRGVFFPPPDHLCGDVIS